MGGEGVLSRRGCMAGGIGWGSIIRTGSECLLVSVVGGEEFLQVVVPLEWPWPL